MKLPQIRRDRFRIELIGKEAQLQVGKDCVGSFEISKEKCTTCLARGQVMISPSGKNFCVDDFKKIADLMDKHEEEIRACLTGNDKVYLK